MLKPAKLACMSLLCVLIVVMASCHRGRYRQRADADAYHLVAEKANSPHWPLEHFTIEMDPRSRMFSPYNPDRPPMPTDDPTSHLLMHEVDHKPGYPHWDANGFTPFAENPDWLRCLPLDERGVLVLDADSSVRLARLHSPDFQGELEELYLSALDVSFERFRFDAQFFGGYSSFFTADGADRRGGGGESSSELDIGLFSLGQRPIALQKMGITGSTLVVGLANRLMWQFSGPDTHTATTLLDFSLVQPLLRGAGRDRVLERLTRAERSLLANVRQMERFRRGFYMEVITGIDAGDGATRAGGVFGGSGLGGFTGVGGGGFGRIAQGGGGGGGTANFGGQTGAGLAGGYIGLLQQQKSIRNQETNVLQLSNSLVQFQEFARANRIDFLQVQQAEQALYNAQSALVNNKTEFENDLDAFKIQLGLPPQVDVDINDDMLAEFDLLDPAIETPQMELNQIQRELGEILIQILNRIELDAGGNPTLVWSGQLADQLNRARKQLLAAEVVRNNIAKENLRRADNDVRQLRASLDQRTQDLERLRRVIEEEGGRVGQDSAVANTVLSTDRLRRRAENIGGLLGEARSRLSEFEPSFRRLDVKLKMLLGEGPSLSPADLALATRRWLLSSETDQDDGGEAKRKVPPFEAAGDRDLHPLSEQLSDLSIGVLELALIQARARADKVTLVPVQLDSGIAFEIARDYRRDLMNRRASLVDGWRLIEFNADNLESTLNVVFEGDIANVGDNPLDLRSSTGRLRAGFQFDAPLTRLDERNTYRQSLIEFQEARRNFYRFRDQLSRTLRRTLRSVELNQLNFELRRAAILVAIEQVELARLRLQEPPRPSEPGQASAGQQFGATTARDLVSALSDLLNAQNDFISVWVSYEVLRRSLDYDLGTMQLSGDGLWLDPGAISPEHGYPAAGEYQSSVCEALVLPPPRLPNSAVEKLEELPGAAPGIAPLPVPDVDLAPANAP